MVYDLTLFTHQVSYARSEQNDNLYIASLFEKAVVKLACFNSYECSVGIDPKFILSIIDDSMTSSCVWLKTDSKQNIIDHIKTEVDSKSSIVIGIRPNLIYTPDSDVKCAHAFVVMDYNLELKAIKLYNPNFS